MRIHQCQPGRLLTIDSSALVSVMLARWLLLLVIVGAGAKDNGKKCCGGKPCGDSCISMKKRCTKGEGSAVCKLGNGCACEEAASNAWEQWERLRKANPHEPTRSFKDALRALVGDDNDPWMSALWRCFLKHGSFSNCLLAVMIAPDRSEL
jgi:hypothetical protein